MPSTCPYLMLLCTTGYGDVTPLRKGVMLQVFVIFVQLASMASVIEGITERQSGGAGLLLRLLGGR